MDCFHKRESEKNESGKRKKVRLCESVIRSNQKKAEAEERNPSSFLISLLFSFISLLFSFSLPVFFVFLFLHDDADDTLPCEMVRKGGGDAKNR